MTAHNSRQQLAAIGLGSQGCEHLVAARQCEHASIIAGVEADANRRALVQNHYADLDLRLYPSVNAMLEATKTSNLHLDGLILALPHHIYPSVWESILKFGLPMLKEKPLGRDYEEALRYTVEADHSDCPLITAIQRRHHPSYRFLKEYLQNQSLNVLEVHGHLHLGKGHPVSPDTKELLQTNTWRHSRAHAGGGALLDAGYHLVDLVHYLCGPFDTVSATLWSNERLDDGQAIDDRAWLTGRAEHCWIMLDIWVQGVLCEDQRSYQKSESLELITDCGLVIANRDGVWHCGQQVFCEDRSWQRAMISQLDQFARQILEGRWNDDSIWDQLPAIRAIEEAYRLSSRY